MTKDSKFDDPASLIASGPASVADWFRALRAGRLDEWQDSWPLTVAEGASHLARENLDTAWLAVAIEILEDLARSQPEREREANLLSAMNLRGYFIAHLGVDRTGGLLDPAILVRWFSRETEISLDVAREKATRWTRLDVQEIRVLRDIKNRLGVFVELERLGILAPYPELQAWLALRDLLP